MCLFVNSCSQVDDDWERHGLNSDVAVVFNIEKKLAVIFGTWYGGENKKGIFSLMNYWLPMNDVSLILYYTILAYFSDICVFVIYFLQPPQLPMHCSANVGKNGESALFFGKRYLNINSLLL